MRDSVLNMVKAVGPTIAARSSEIEQARQLPIDVVELLRPLGAFRLFVAPEFDSPDLSAWEGLEVLEELAFHDGATGWCSMISSTTSLLSSVLPDAHAREIFAEPTSITGGFAMPVGRAVPVDGGLRVSGRWSWGSGAQHCTWIGGGCVVVDKNGSRQPRSDGLAHPFVFFSADEVQLIDNWHVSGLCGTGSGDYEVSDVFVPEGRWVQVGVDQPVRQNSLSRFSFFGLLACGVAACAVGIGRRSIAELVALAETKTPQSSRRTLAQRSPVQAEVAIAEAKLASAWSFMHSAIASSWDAVERGDEPTIEQRRQLRLSATHATQTAAEVAEAMYKAGGGAAVYASSPLQRIFRDAHVATQHAMVAPRTLETFGRLRLGLETDTRTL